MKHFIKAYTTNSDVQEIIHDDEVNTGSTWSSSKINGALAKYISGVDGNIGLKIKYGYELVQGSKTIDLSSYFANIVCVQVTPIATSYQFIASASIVSSNKIQINVKVDGSSGYIECYWLVIGY